MGRLTVSLDPRATLFLVEVEIDNIPAVKNKRKAQGGPDCLPVRTLALVDTGASVRAATDKIIRRLQLPSKSDRVCQTMTAGGAIETLEYFGTIKLVQAPDLRVDYTTIQQYQFDKAPFDFIIGMSVLMRWNYSYSRVDQKLTLELP